MIEELLLQFGALGIVAYVVVFYNGKLERVINNNTKALIEVKQTTLKCHRNKNNNQK
ncbi:MAG: hypothetical protein ACOC1P_00630 [Minisyncoccales bacterium]